MIFDESCLRTGIETTGAGREHHILKEHPVIEPASLTHDPIDQKKQTHGRTKESVIFCKLSGHVFPIPLGNP